MEPTEFCGAHSFQKPCCAHFLKIQKNKDEREGCHCFQMDNTNDATIKDRTPLSTILFFCDRFATFLQNLHPHQTVVVISATQSDPSYIETLLFVGCFLILYEGMTVEAVKAGLQDATTLEQDSAVVITRSSKEVEVCIMGCWRAFEQAVKLTWLVHPNSDIEPVLDVEELAHYADRANGSLHMVVPGRLIFFPTPDDLPDRQHWADHVTDHGRTVRRFSAAYYAETFGFEELRVSVVACLGRGSEAAAAAFEARGVETVDLGLAEDGSSLLRGLDRLFSLSRAVAGAVAVHSGDGFVWPEYVETLVAAFLIRREGFDEGSARAWLRMVSPWMVGGGGVPGTGGAD